MRKNRFDSDNPMDQFLFCFGSGEDKTGGGSAADFDDTVSTKVGGGATREYESQIDAALDRGEDVTFERLQRATGDLPEDDQALADRAAFQQARDRATALSNDQIMSLLDEAARENIGQFGLTPTSTGGAVPPPSDARTVLTYDQRVLGMDPLLQEAVKRQQQQAPRTTVTDYEGDIFAMDGMADPFQTMQMAAPVNIPTPTSAQVQEARSAALGSPNDIRNRENIVRNNIDLETGLPVSVRQANAPTFNTVPNYDETDYLDMGEGLSLVEARQKAVSDLKSRAGSNEPFNTGLGFGIVDALLNATLRPDQMAQKMLDEKGQVVYSTAPGQGIIGVVDPKTGNIQPTSGNFFNRELNPVYEQYRKEPERGDGGDQQAAPAVTAPVAPATCPPGYRFNEKTNACEYVGQVYPGATPYSGQPITASTQYTGIGGLQPFVLQPTYTAQTSFQPLYRV